MDLEGLPRETAVLADSQGGSLQVCRFSHDGAVLVLTFQPA